jgi:8-oxo-dGTP diphosphatase
MYKALVVDVDGTIVPPTGDGTTITRATIDAVVSTRRRGGKIGIATGRSWSAAQSVVKRLGITDLCIVEGGAQIVNPVTEEIIWETYINSGAIDQIYELFGRYSTGKEFVKSSAKQERVRVNDARSSGLPERIIYFVGADKTIAEQVQASAKQLKDVTATMVNPSWAGRDMYDVHITSRNGTKGRALVRWVEYLGIQASEVISMGDSLNDVSIFREAGLKIAVNNAAPELKKLADHVVANENWEGVQAVLAGYIGVNSDVDIYKAAGIIIKDRRLLVERSKGKDVFIAPGGKLNPGETSEQALIRELKEEFQMTVTKEDVELFGVYYADAAGSHNIGKKLHMDVFVVKNFTEIRPDSEVEEIRWITSRLPEDIEVGSVFAHDVLPKLKKLDLVD